MGVCVQNYINTLTSYNTVLHLILKMVQTWRQIHILQILKKAKIRINLKIFKFCKYYSSRASCLDNRPPGWSYQGYKEQRWKWIYSQKSWCNSGTITPRDLPSAYKGTKTLRLSTKTLQLSTKICQLITKTLQLITKTLWLSTRILWQSTKAPWLSTKHPDWVQKQLDWPQNPLDTFLVNKNKLTE